MSKTNIIKGKVWVLTDKEGKAIDDIDTDMIFHNRYLAITEMEKMGQYSLDNLPGWEDFPKKVEKGDILVVGKNFGSGSSRQQAVDCFRALGMIAIVGESFGAIYKRNVINVGFPLVSCDGIASSGKVQTGDTIEIDLANGKIMNHTRSIEIQGKPLSKVQMDIYQSGDLFSYGKTIE